MALSPSSGSVYNGQTITFTCPLVSGALQYIWNTGAQPSSGTGRVRIVTGSNPSLSDISGISITCTAKDDLGNTLAIHEATLTVRTVPATGISVSPTSMALSYTNQYGYMTGTPTTNISGAEVSSPEVNYASSDDSICVVSPFSGMLNAEGNGVVNVWVGCNSYPGIAGYCTVTVTGFPVAVTGVSVSPTTMYLVVGSTGVITPTVTPSNAEDKSVQWFVQPQGIVEISAGTVFAVSPGTAYVTCSTVDGGYTAQCAVIVTSQRPPDWAWSYPITSGGETYDAYIINEQIVSVPMTCTEWNNFTTRINEFRRYKGYYEYTFTTVTSGMSCTPAILNEAFYAISAFAAGVQEAVAGNIPASLFNNFRDKLNSVQ